MYITGLLHGGIAGGEMDARAMARKRGARRMKASNPSGAKGRERTARRAMAIAAATATASFLVVGPAAAAPASTPHSAAPAAAAAKTTRSRMLTLINGD